MGSHLPADPCEMPSHVQAGQVAPHEIPMAPDLWIRNRRRTRAWSAVAVVWSVVVASRLLVAGGGSRASEVTLVFAAIYLPLAVLGVVLAIRIVRAGVRIGADGVVVRGPFRTQTVALDTALRFSPGLQGRGGNGTPCPMLGRRGQRAVGVWALGRRNIWFRYDRVCQEIQPACDELNALVESVR
jgi:hypothetical protein